jgi:hypothetical protein
MTAAAKRAARDVGAQPGSALDLTLPLTIGGIDRLRRAAAQARAIGGDAEWLGRHIEIWLADQPDERLRRRDDAIIALVPFCEPGSYRHLAMQIRAMALRYETTRWPRERMLDASPLVHGAKGAALFALLRASGASGAPGFETIRKSLAAAGVGERAAVALTQNIADRGASAQSPRRAKLNATIKPDQLDVLAALARQPATQKLLADDRSRTIAERQARVDRIKALDAKAEIEWPKGQAEIKEAREKVREAERHLREANKALAGATAAAMNTSWAYTKARQAEETPLIDGADVATIAAWKRELQDEMAALQRPGVLVHSESVERHPVTRREIRRGYTNVASVRARLAAVVAAFRAADLLALEPDQARLPAIIAETRASWPKVDQNPSFVETAAA